MKARIVVKTLMLIKTKIQLLSKKQQKSQNNDFLLVIKIEILKQKLKLMQLKPRKLI